MNKKNKWKIVGGVCLLLLLFFFIIPVPEPLFSDPYSTVLEDREGELLSARIAGDGQWRFPEGAKVPEKFSVCIRLFEDEHFFRHPGINPVSMFRALKQNLEKGKVVSGGSTLTMQVVRLSRKGKPRTVWQKLVEIFWALRLEFRHSKREILQLYASHAPFGGNVVGLEAASWRYYKRSPGQLSWAETATLAVLPNAPSLIYPGKNRKALLNKRNRLLEKLKQKGFIDETTAQLAMDESLPGKPHSLPREAVHLLNRSLSEGKAGNRLKTTLIAEVQRRLNKITESNYLQFRQNEIHNLSVLLIDNKKNKVIGYVGNSNPNAANNGHRVDVITARRSTGSLLKPFLYGLAWQDGLIFPQSILPDIPTRYGNYAPKNFNKKYDGAISSSEALIKSLNVPAVRLLHEYRLERFYDEIQSLPLPSVNRGAEHYGLSIILGGAESTLWEICTAYKGISESLRNIQDRNYSYVKRDYDFPAWLLADTLEKSKIELTKTPVLNAAAIWQLVSSLKELNRPGREEGWESFSGRKKVAWKTGTSFGLRDAWAVGINPDYTVGVWVGNADGEGRPGLTGLDAAAPILFEVFDFLPESEWYSSPFDELHKVTVCSVSGLLQGLHCPEVDTVLSGKNYAKVKSCTYHQLFQLNKEGNRLVNSSCYSVSAMKTKAFFILPPLMEYYYKKSEPDYRALPQREEGCLDYNDQPMELISPENANKILVPIELGGEKGRLVVEIAHRNSASTIYWHLDEEFIGLTENNHLKELNPLIGKHRLTLVDDEGNTLSTDFEIVD